MFWIKGFYHEFSNIYYACFRMWNFPRRLVFSQENPQGRGGVYLGGRFFLLS